jgi:hypothetical protein
MYVSSNGHGGPGKGLGGVGGTDKPDDGYGEHAPVLVIFADNVEQFRVSIICGCGREYDYAYADRTSATLKAISALSLSTPAAPLDLWASEGDAAEAGEEGE